MSNIFQRDSFTDEDVSSIGPAAGPQPASSQALVAVNPGGGALLPRKPSAMPKPSWHPPWKLYRVISGHLGWVRCIAFEPGNEWFCTGSADRVIKVFTII